MRDFITFATYRLIGGMVGHLPPSIGYWVAGRAGWLLYLLSPRLRHTVTDNIRHVLGPGADESRVDSLVRQACVHIVKGHYDLFRVARLSNQEIERLLHLEGWENLENAAAEGRGVIVFSAHMGNVELVTQVPGVRGLAAVSPVLRLPNERLFQYTRRLRQSHGLRLIPTDEPMIALFRALKRGEVVGLAADRDVADSGRAVEFFGTPTRLPDGPVRVALRTNATLVPAFALRLPDNSVMVTVEPALDLVRTGDQEADIDAGMRIVVALMERRIREHPEQWIVAQPIWPNSSVQPELAK